MKEEILKKLSEKRQKYIEQKCSGLSFNDDEYEAYILMKYFDNLKQENEKLKEQQGKIIGHINACCGEEGLSKSEVNYIKDILKEDKE